MMPNKLILIADPDREVLRELGKALHDRGYEIPVPVESEYTFNPERQAGFRAYQNKLSGPVAGSTLRRGVSFECRSCRGPRKRGQSSVTAPSLRAFGD